MRLVKGLVLGAVVVVVLVFAAAFLSMAFVFSIGTAIVPLRVVTTVRDAGSRQPVAGCLVTFETRTGRREARTDGEGRASVDTEFEYVGSPLMFWERERHPQVLFYLGPAPAPGGGEVEALDVTARLDAPWRDGPVTPALEIERWLAKDASYVGEYGPRTAVDKRKVGALAAGRATGAVEWSETPRFRLELMLDPQQAAACREAGRR